MTAEPVWISEPAILVLHDRSIALHGGAPGLRDLGLLQSALARPANRFHYEAQTSLCALAATYLVAIASNHPFVDGNKRAAFLAAGLFLRRNGLRLTASQPEAAHRVFAVAAGDHDIEALAAWIEGRTAPTHASP